jgi:hypothetical protein
LLISTGRATIADLTTVLSLADAYVLLDILAVDNYNRRVLNGDHN